MLDSRLKEQDRSGRHPEHSPVDTEPVCRAEVPRFSVHSQSELHGQPRTIIDQVKSVQVNVSPTRDIKGVLDREMAVIGIYISLEEPTQPMRTEGVSAGFYTP